MSDKRNYVALVAIFFIAVGTLGLGLYFDDGGLMNRSPFKVPRQIMPIGRDADPRGDSREDSREEDAEEEDGEDGEGKGEEEDGEGEATKFLGWKDIEKLSRDAIKASFNYKQKFHEQLKNIYGDSNPGFEEVTPEDMGLGDYVDFETPDNFLYASVVTPDSVEIDIEDLSLANPGVATIFSVCTIGDKAAMVDSAAFALDGGWGGEIEFELYRNDDPLWDEPLESQIGYWPGDVNFDYNISLDPGECMLLTVTYTDVAPFEWNSPEFDVPVWARFDLRGMGSTLPTYFLQKGSWDGWLTKMSEDDELKGTLNVFDHYNALLVEDAEYEDNYYGLDVPYVYLGYFELQTYPNSTAHIDSVELTLETDFEGPFTTEMYSSTSCLFNFCNDNGGAPFFKDVELNPGKNIIEVDADMGFNNYGFVEFTLEGGPGEEGTFQLTLDEVNTDGDVYIGKNSWYMGDEDTSAFDELVGQLVHIIDAEANISDPDVSVYYGPKGWHENWYGPSSIVVESVVDGINNYEHQMLDMNFGNDIIFEDEKPVHVDSFTIEVKGNWNLPIPVQVKTIDSGMIWYEEETNAFDTVILPGSEIYFEGFDLEPHHTYYIEVAVTEFPEEANQQPLFMRFKVPEMSVTYVEDGIKVEAGDEVPKRVHNDDHNFVFDYEWPIISGKSFFGPPMIYVTDVFGAGGAQMIFLDEIDQDDMFTMNNACFKAQGGVVIKEFTYAHMVRDESPFDDIILETGDNIVYLKDAVWTDEYVTFKLTNPEIYEESQFCLKLDVVPPTEELEQAWFDLIDIDAESLEGGNVPTYNPYSPINPELMSQENPVNGTVYYFYE